ncbi:MAG: hypothetical protein GF331_16995, partial [Chitinivibrionales bacterium]|nr:hypothetical protein [Chitinivibrionales bacterium]
MSTTPTQPARIALKHTLLIAAICAASHFRCSPVPLLQSPRVRQGVSLGIAGVYDSYHRYLQLDTVVQVDHDYETSITH